jgi:hypothetical protein
MRDPGRVTRRFCRAVLEQGLFKERAVEKEQERGASQEAASSPQGILQLGMGFFGSRTCLSAVELGLFTELANGPLDESKLRNRLGLHARGARDFFDVLVATGLLRRLGARYSNTAESALFLDRAKPSYIGGLLEMCASRLYSFWGSLTEALRTGKPQNEAKAGGSAFDAMYADPQRLRGFLGAMTGISMGSARAIAQRFRGRNTARLPISAPPRAACRCRSPWRTSTSSVAASICQWSGRYSMTTSKRSGSSND